MVESRQARHACGVSGTLTADVSIVKLDLVEFLLGFGLCFSKALSCSLEVCRTARNVHTSIDTSHRMIPDQIKCSCSRGDSPTSLL